MALSIDGGIASQSIVLYGWGKKWVRGEEEMNKKRKGKLRDRVGGDVVSAYELW